MDFTNRGPQPQSAAPAPAPKSKRERNSNGKWKRIGVTVIGALVVILILAVIAVVSFGGPKSEDKYVDSSKLQAVFLNTGQVYFGNVKALNNKYFVLTNIYYLQATDSSGSSSSSSSTSSSANNITLVKLGCELHEPYDQMVINSDQVTFWENLQDGGQVAKAVKTFEQQNPNGQKCADQSSSASSNSSSAAQNAGSNSGSSNSSSSSSSSGQ
ncbi:MAG TPA: hypothetical protein VHC21_01155 [Candidatus Saccharimonadales bacterium]|nr:hypothetical protein [Candidatus Saccharimonadales bacterium]